MILCSLKAPYSYIYLDTIKSAQEMDQASQFSAIDLYDAYT